jgi:phytanoyl-CoA hydroxylase
MKKALALLACCTTLSLFGFTRFTATDSLSDEMKAAFERDGFIVIENFLTPEQCNRLQEEAQKIVDDFDPSLYCAVFSSTSDNNGEDKVKDQRGEYFFNSVDKISCFLEEKAVENGKLIVDKNRSVNKIGHALHDKNPVFEAVSFSPRVVQYSHDLGIIDPILLQSMYIFKYARIGGAVHPHQDATFLYTEPSSAVAFWIPVHDATVENACLWVAPGTHKGPLKTRFVCDANRNTKFIQWSPEACPLTDHTFIPVEVPKGSLLIFHDKLIHKSEENYSEHDRNAYTFHVISGAARYAEDNWLQRPDAPRLVVHNPVVHNSVVHNVTH